MTLTSFLFIVGWGIAALLVVLFHALDTPPKPEIKKPRKKKEPKNYL